MIDINSKPCNFTDGEYDLAVKHLNKDNTLLEYGCGISTIKFSSLVKRLISIEHSKPWFIKVQESINYYNISNVEVHLAEPDDKDSDYAYAPWDLKELSQDQTVRTDVLKSYIEYQNNFDYDDIFIDGRARLFCIEEAYKNLTKDSTIIFHDFINRPWYHSCLNKFEIVDKVDTLAILKKM